eukprot:1151813-Pelagomonas_calceolata.AAC.7
MPVPCNAASRCRPEGKTPKVMVNNENNGSAAGHEMLPACRQDKWRAQNSMLSREAHSTNLPPSAQPIHMSKRPTA